MNSQASSDVCRAQLDRARKLHLAGEGPWTLFEHRVRGSRAAHDPLPLTPLAQTRPALEAALDGPAGAGERVVYVHLPFCRSFCSFCGYQRVLLREPQALETYVAALRRQLQTFASRPWAQARPFSAVHFGGGTPTVLPVQTLAALVRELAEALPLTANAEVTVESTVSELQPAGFDVLANAGVNRLALGVQSFDTELRRGVGRRAPQEDVLARVAQARDAGISNVCVDLMYGLPGQTEQTWQADLDLARRCGATGVSVYSWVAFPTANLTRKLEPGQASFLDAKTEYERFVAADQALVGQAGWERLTPVQYAATEGGGATYAVATGRSAEVLALGAGSVGRVGDVNYFTSADPEAYLQGFDGEAHTWPIRGALSGAVHAQVRRASELGTLTYAQPDPSAPEASCLAELVTQLVELGLARTEGVAVQLTQAGCYWGANICQLVSLAIHASQGRQSA